MGRQSDDFGELMVQTVTVEPFLSNDGYHDTYGPPVTYPCIIESKVFNVTKPDGSIAPTTAQIYLDGDAVVGIQDRITFEGKSPVILKVGVDLDIEVPTDIYCVTVFT